MVHEALGELKTQGKYPLCLLTLSGFCHKNNNCYCSLEPQEPSRISETKHTLKYNRDSPPWGVSENLPSPPTTPSPALLLVPAMLKSKHEDLQMLASVLPELCQSLWNPRLTSKSTSSLLIL